MRNTGSNDHQLRGLSSSVEFGGKVSNASGDIVGWARVGVSVGNAKHPSIKKHRFAEHAADLGKIALRVVQLVYVDSLHRAGDRADRNVCVVSIS